MKHTPGPWTLVPLEEDFPVFGRSPLGNERIIGASRISPGIVFGGLGDETDANALLIVAAPELYDALKAVIANHCGNDKVFCSTCSSARALLARIDGEKS